MSERFGGCNVIAVGFEDPDQVEKGRTVQSMIQCGKRVPPELEDVEEAVLPVMAALDRWVSQLSKKA